MSSPKFSLELRLAVVTYYLNTRNGYSETAKRFSVGRTAVHCWISAWQQPGIDGLIWKAADYTPEFRLTGVRAVIGDKLSLRYATAKVNLSGESTVYQWVKRFKASGAGALTGIKSGRPKKWNPCIRTSPPRQNYAKIPLMFRSGCATFAPGSTVQRRKVLIIQEMRRGLGLNDLLRAVGMACSTLYPNLSVPGKADKHRTLKERIPDIYHHHKGRRLSPDNAGAPAQWWPC